MIINFSYPLSQEQLRAVEKQVKTKNLKIVEVDCRLDIDKPFGEQIPKIVDKANITESEWNTQRILVVPPPISQAAILVVEEIATRCGYQPEIIRIKRRNQSKLSKYILAEIIDLERYAENKPISKK